MAEFCKQCAEEHQWSNDAKIVWEQNKDSLTEEQIKDGKWGFTFLCEGCGFTLIGAEGKCLGWCDLANHDGC